ncbi:MAG TPA: LuxR C-terminal-related transcriptional regulator, partial [Pilimelia sp.]|nr:LuxR C-terminal-related transcriptional regulator [Pilimelia sp.]
VMLRGGPGVDLSPVTAALLAGGLPFALEQFPAPPDEARGPQRWHRGPTVLVLVEPGPGDWPTARTTPIVLVRGGQQPPVDMADALARSIAGVLPVDRVAEDLVPAVTLAAHGYLTMDSGWARAWLAGRSGAPVGGLPELTVRESDILRSIAAGHTVRQTARSLGIAEKTVENTQARLFRKLGAHNRAGALATAHAWGLVDPSPPAADGSLSCVCPPVT